MEFLGEWGERGDGPGQLSQPAGIATDRNGFVYLADAGSGFIHKFDSLGSPRFSFHDPLLERPAGIAVDRGGAIYVTDSARHQVVIFFPDGRRMRRLAGGPGQRLQSPAGIAVGEDGNFYVAEQTGHRVQQFESGGKFLRSWGREGTAPGEFRAPSGIAIGPDGSVYVADTGNARVQKFTSEGEFVAAWSAPGAALTGVAAGGGFVLTADAATGRLQVWREGAPQPAEQELPGVSRTGTPSALHLAFGARQQLFVLDAGRARVLRFRINFQPGVAIGGKLWKDSASRPSENGEGFCVTGEVHMINEEIGQTAGRIWHTLDEEGQLRLATLQKQLGVSQALVLLALGWLAREDKVHIETYGRTFRVRLK
jgi:tripartite motif-containing protein 71